jgi:hypothetical protein
MPPVALVSFAAGVGSPARDCVGNPALRSAAAAAAKKASRFMGVLSGRVSSEADLLDAAPMCQPYPTIVSF